MSMLGATMRATNPNHLNTERILFHVHRDGSVDLCLGPTSVAVCGKPEEFDEFVEDVTRRLKVIAKEIREDWCE